MMAMLKSRMEQRVFLVQVSFNRVLDIQSDLRISIESHHNEAQDKFPCIGNFFIRIFQCGLDT
jgi:hypothetical protein